MVTLEEITNFKESLKNLTSILEYLNPNEKLSDEEKKCLETCANFDIGTTYEKVSMVCLGTFFSKGFIPLQSSAGKEIFSYLLPKFKKEKGELSYEKEICSLVETSYFSQYLETGFYVLGMIPFSIYLYLGGSVENIEKRKDKLDDMYTKLFRKKSVNKLKKDLNLE